MDSGDPPARTPVHIGVLPASALVLLGRQMAEATLDDDEPDAALLNKRSLELERLSLALAKANPNDPRAVEKLRAQAGSHRKDLRRAAARVRMGGLHREERSTFVANENLVSAAHGGVVTPLTEEQEHWFPLLEGLDQAPEAESFEQLATSEPGLKAFEEHRARGSSALALTGRAGRCHR